MNILKTLLILVVFLGIIPLFAIFIFYRVYFNNIQDFVFLNELNENLSDNNLSDGDAILKSNLSGQSPKIITFYNNIRFKSSLISYSISSDCNQRKLNASHNAFDIIQNKTILEFYELNNNAEINVYCSEEVKELKGNYFVAGEGGPDFIVNTSKYNVIVNGTVLLYKNSGCDEPVVAIHEILHALGFKHSLNKNSIMYATSDCHQEITKEIIDEINYLYEDPALPDLTFIKLNARRKTVFLNFESEIKNIGLSNAENASLSIYSGNDFIKRYNLGDIDFGEGKIFKVSNVMFLHQSSNLTFVIDNENTIPEINEENNKVDLVLAD